MIFWVREIAGWVLIALGLAAFGVVFGLVFQYAIFQVVILTVIGIFLFRGGIHLIKVAVAARACREAQRRLYPDVAIGSAPLPPGAGAVSAGWAGVSARVRATPSTAGP